MCGNFLTSCELLSSKQLLRAVTYVAQTCINNHVVIDSNEPLHPRTLGRNFDLFLCTQAKLHEYTISTI
jgi:hypothetical protein